MDECIFVSEKPSNLGNETVGATVLDIPAEHGELHLDVSFRYEIDYEDTKEEKDSDLEDHVPLNNETSPAEQNSYPGEQDSNQEEKCNVSHLDNYVPLNNGTSSPQEKKSKPGEQDSDPEENYNDSNLEDYVPTNNDRNSPQEPNSEPEEQDLDLEEIYSVPEYFTPLDNEITILEEQFVCKEEHYVCCHKTFSLVENLYRHILELHSASTKKIVCEICLEEFRNKDYLLLHIENTHAKAGNKNDQLISYDDPKDFSPLGNAEISRELRKVRYFYCKTCVKKFTSKQRVNRHILERHCTRSTKFACDLCLKVFKQKNYLILHIKYGHEKTKRNYQLSSCADRKVSKPLDSKDDGDEKRILRRIKYSVCTICANKFTSVLSLSRHILEFHCASTKKYACNSCLEEFRHKDYLIQHIKFAHESKENKNNRLNLRDNDPKYPAFLDNKDDGNGKRILRRVEYYICTKCAKKITSVESVKSLSRHILQFHWASTKKIVCDICRGEFMDKGYLLLQIENGTFDKTKNKDDRLIWYDDLKDFSTLGNDKTSLEQPNVKYYDCRICAKKFTSAQNVSRHILEFHCATYKKFNCDLCLKGFRQKNYLILHIKNAHEKIGKKNEQIVYCDDLEDSESRDDEKISPEEQTLCKAKHSVCTICLKKFTLLESLNRHVLEFHCATTNKFACDFCLEEFTQRDYLIRHLKISHEDNVNKNNRLTSYRDKPENSASVEIYEPSPEDRCRVKYYVCTRCAKIFTIEKSLNRHITEHSYTSTEKIECDLCLKECQQKNSLITKHVNSAHKIGQLILCDVPKEYPSLKNYQTRSEELSREKNCTCQFCVKKFKSEQILSRHVLEFHCASTQKIACDVCLEEFRRKNYLIRHIKNTHQKKKYENQQFMYFNDPEDFVSLDSKKTIEEDQDSEDSGSLDNEKTNTGSQDSDPENSVSNDNDRSGLQKLRKAKYLKNKHFMYFDNPEDFLSLEEQDPELGGSVSMDTKNTRTEDQYSNLDVSMSLNNEETSIENQDYDLEDSVSLINNRGTLDRQDCNHLVPLVIDKTSPQKLCKEKYCVCTFCAKSFTEEQNLNRHILESHCASGKKFACDLCLKEFRHKDYLKRHMKYAHVKKGNTNNLSNYCGKNDQSNYCGCCNISFENKAKFNQHLAWFRRNSNNNNNKKKKRTVTKRSKEEEKKRIFICDYCQKTQATKCGMKLHIIMHMGLCVCKEIKNISRNRELKQTIVCVCKQKNKSQENKEKKNDINAYKRRTKYQNIKLDAKFKCGKCLRGYSQIYSLRAHIVEKHTQTKGFSCMQCGKQYNTRTLL